MRLLPNGIGETVSDQLAIGKPLYQSGQTWYVNSVGGVNGASPAGLNRSAPLATLDQALTNASDGDIIILESGHSETLTSALSITESLTIIGCGLVNGKPGASLRANAAATYVLDVLAAGVELRNIYFPGNAQNNSLEQIHVASTQFRLSGCYFDLSSKDQASAVNVIASSHSLRVTNTQFVSGGTSVALRPYGCLKVSGAVNDVDLDGVVFDGGLYGFSSEYALNAAAAITRLRGQNLSLLRGADVQLTAGTVGWLQPTTTTGDARIVWP